MVCGLRWKSCDCPWFNYENVDTHLGNPVRYQEEMDRRRDQEQRDEALARRMQALGVGGRNDANRDVFGIGNMAGHHMNANFIQQAREALTANYQNAEQAARGLINGWYTGRENQLPGFPGAPDETPEILRQGGGPREHEGERRPAGARPGEPGYVPIIALDPADPRPVRRGTNRRRSAIVDMFANGMNGRSQTTEEREQERRIQDWANGVSGS